MANIANSTLNNTATSQADNSFQALTGKLCCLTQSDNGNQAKSIEDEASTNSRSGQMSFNGFQDTIEQQYSLPKDDAKELLTMLLNVLEDLIGSVVKNLEDSSSDKATKAEVSKETAENNQIESSNTTESNDTSMGGCPYHAAEKGEEK